MIIFEGTGVGGKDVVIMGAGTGGCLTQSGWEAMEAKNKVARDGYVSVRRDSTTDSRPAPVPSNTGIPVPSRVKPRKILAARTTGGPFV